MPFFSKMMGSYPMQLIRGLPDSVKFAAGVGAGVGVYSNRRGRIGGAIRGGVVGGAIAGGALGYSALGGIGGIRTLGRNLMRPGMAGMYGRSFMGAARGATAGGMRGLSGIAGRLSRMF